MNIQPTARRVTLAVAAAAAALSAAPVAAHAQSYSSYDRNGQYYYDGCRRDRNSRAVAGGVIGGLAGMAAGNNLSDRRSHRREGAVAGALLGALAGSAIGRSTAGCEPEYRPRQTYSYNNYSGGYAYTPDYSYGYQDDDYYYDRYARSYDYARPSYDYGRPPLACTYAESPVRMPDGRTQKRMVQVCPDSRGDYQIVE